MAYCVDIKENSRSIPCVTEINIGRFFTTSNFFSAAGLNMPHMYLKLAFGEAIAEVPKVNPIPPDLYWVRGIDRTPRLFTKPEWSARKLK